MALEKISLHCILNKKKYLAIFQFFEKMFFNFKEASTKHLCHTQSILVVKGVYVCVTQGGGGGGEGGGGGLGGVKKDLF